jgi:type II restriction enzyme
MNLSFDSTGIKEYKSTSQKIRVSTELWVKKEIYCPYCDGSLIHSKNNTPVVDFYCDKCKEEYQLKSFKANMPSKVLGGAYSKMLDALQNSKNPNFFFLQYDINYDIYNVVNFIAVPKFIFTPKLIERRRPLSEHAKLPGWTGCNILIKNIPEECKVSYVKNGKIIQKNKIIKDWHRILFLKKEKNFSKKNWLLDIINCIDSLNKKEFSLDEIYSFEGMLSKKHKKNKHIKDKIRQQLQILRDNKYLTFVSRGQYKIV